MRAALLPTPGDPHLLAYWLRNLETWREYVDEVVVWVDGPGSDETYLMLAAAGIEVVGERRRVGHPEAIDRLLHETDAEYVVLCEDDAYVRNPRVVRQMFDLIEGDEVDVVGSPRQENYWDSPIETHWGPLTTDPAELRRGLWPAFLFAKRADLLATDRIFDDRRWELGETITGTDIVVTPELCREVGIAPDFVHLDVMFSTTFQLRAKGLRIGLVNRVRTFDARATEEWVKYDPPWFHVTGLSTLDDALSGRTDLPDMDEHGGLWTRRVAWWLRVAQTDERRQALYAFMERSGIAETDVEAWARRFQPWVTWDEGNGIRADADLTITHVLPDPTLGDHTQRRCIWCGGPTAALAITPFRPDLGALPLMLTCGAHMRVVYRRMQQGLALDAWEQQAVARIGSMPAPQLGAGQ